MTCPTAAAVSMQQPIYTHETTCNTSQLPLHQLLVHSRHQGTNVSCKRSINQGLERRHFWHVYSGHSQCIHTVAARQIACKGSSTALSEQSQDDVAEVCSHIRFEQQSGVFWIYFVERHLQVPANQQGFRHAILHDFCMSIPYGSVVLAAGVVSLLFGSGKQGLTFALAGTGILASSFFSLVQWRAQRPSTTFTLLSTGKQR